MATDEEAREAIYRRAASTRSSKRDWQRLAGLLFEDLEQCQQRYDALMPKKRPSVERVDVPSTENVLLWTFEQLSEARRRAGPGGLVQQRRRRGGRPKKYDDNFYRELWHLTEDVMRDQGFRGQQQAAQFMACRLASLTAEPIG